MPRSRPNNVTDEQIIAAYAETQSTPKVSAILGLGEATVHRVLKKHGVPMVGLVEYRKTMRPAPGTKYVGVYAGSTEQILGWYRDGVSMREIASRIGRSVHVVSRRVKAAGIARPFGAGGADHSMWSGGRLKSDGYWRVWVSDDDPMASMRTDQGYVLEHRLNMARKLGRPLRDSETVHHIDGDRGNNDLSNLELRQGKHGKHIVMCCLDCGSHNVAPVEIGREKGT